MTRGKPPEWQIRCPWCQAPAGQRCTRPSGGRTSVASHDARIRAWTTHLTAQHHTGETR